MSFYFGYEKGHKGTNAIYLSLLVKERKQTLKVKVINYLDVYLQINGFTSVSSSVQWDLCSPPHKDTVLQKQICKMHSNMQQLNRNCYFPPQQGLSYKRGERQSFLISLTFISSKNFRKPKLIVEKWVGRESWGNGKDPRGKKHEEKGKESILAHPPLSVSHNQYVQLSFANPFQYLRIWKLAMTLTTVFSHLVNVHIRIVYFGFSDIYSSQSYFG